MSGGEYLGGVSVGGEIPAVSAALVGLADAVTRANALLQQVAQAIRDAKLAIRVPAVFGLELQLSANLDVQAAINLNLGDPLGYAAGIIAAVEGVVAAITTLPPLPALDAQLSASLALAASLELQIGTIDLALGALDRIVDMILALIASLSAALAALATLLRQLSQTGAHSLVYRGPLGGLGLGFDAVTPLTGISPGTFVTAPLVLVTDASAPAKAALEAVFKVHA